MKTQLIQSKAQAKIRKIPSGVAPISKKQSVLRRWVQDRAEIREHTRRDTSLIANMTQEGATSTSQDKGDEAQEQHNNWRNINDATDITTRNVSDNVHAIVRFRIIPLKVLNAKLYQKG